MGDSSCDAPIACEYCQAEATNQRQVPSVYSEEGRWVDVCEQCAEDLDSSAKREKARDIEECRGDYERDARKMEFDR